MRRHSGTTAGNLQKSYTFMPDYSKEGSLVTGAKDYSYLNATMGSTRMARRAGM